MSRVSIIEQMYAKEKRKKPYEFNWDALWAPPIMTLFTEQDIMELYRIATSVRYAGNLSKKYDLIDELMKKRGFRRAHTGTNRLVYNYMESGAFVAKVAVDKVGMSDSPKEYINQEFFKPFCCKIFEVHPSGVIAFVERVNPISSLEEFMSISDDVFYMLVTKIIGKYAIDDLGTRTFMNFGIRHNAMGVAFGPVIIDFPYVYEIDGNKLRCQTQLIDPITHMPFICNGEIDYKPGFNGLYCTKCGREFKAMDLAKDKSLIRVDLDFEDPAYMRKIAHYLRARIIDSGKTIIDSGHSSKTYISKEDFETMGMNDELENATEVIVAKTVTKKRKENAHEYRNSYYSELQMQYYNEQVKKNPMNPVIKQTTDPELEPVMVSKTVKSRPHQNNDDDFDSDFVFIPVGSEGPLEDVLVTEVVDRDGNIIEVSPTGKVIDLNDLEKTTFPEMARNEHYVPEDIEVSGNVMLPIEDDEETSAVAATTENKPLPVNSEGITIVEAPLENVDVSVLSDGDIQAINEENARRGIVKQEDTDANIIYPETANNPELNPMVLPYTRAKESVSVESKLEYRDEDNPLNALSRSNAPRIPKRQEPSMVTLGDLFDEVIPKNDGGGKKRKDKRDDPYSEE